MDVRASLRLPAPARGRSPSRYGHLALHAFAVIAFFAQVSYAVASFLGFAAVGAVAPSMHEAAPDVQPWIESRVD